MPFSTAVAACQMALSMAFATANLLSREPWRIIWWLLATFPFLPGGITYTTCELAVSRTLAMIILVWFQPYLAIWFILAIVHTTKIVRNRRDHARVYRAFRFHVYCRLWASQRSAVRLTRKLSFSMEDAAYALGQVDAKLYVQALVLVLLVFHMPGGPLFRNIILYCVPFGGLRDVLQRVLSHPITYRLFSYTATLLILTRATHYLVISGPDHVFLSNGNCLRTWGVRKRNNSGNASTNADYDFDRALERYFVSGSDVWHADQTLQARWDRMVLIIEQILDPFFEGAMLGLVCD